jgi:hypothetical protein
MIQTSINAGSVLQIHSGSHLLSFDGKDTSTIETGYWQGTIVYFELHSDKVINPKDVFEGRADVEGGYDQLFEEEDGLGRASCGFLLQSSHQSHEERTGPET